MSEWAAVYEVAGCSLEIRSEVGDPSPLLPPHMGLFRRGGEPLFTVEFVHDEAAQADPLRFFYHPQFRVIDSEESPGSYVFEKRYRPGWGLGSIDPQGRTARLGLPFLEGPWRLPQEEEGVAEAVSSFVRACLQLVLLERGGSVLHAAGLILEGNGYAFSGRTGSGKTTLARQFPVASVLGDDMVAFSPSEGGYRLYGTPWAGREGGHVSYGGVPLRALFLLRPWRKRGVVPVRPAEALGELAADAPRLGFQEEEQRLIDVFSRLVEEIPVYGLSWRLGEKVAGLLEGVLAREKESEPLRPGGKERVF